MVNTRLGWLVSRSLVLLAATLFCAPSKVAASAFDFGIPPGWTCAGNCGTLGANGVVTTSPEGGDYGWVSTSGGVDDVALPGVGGSGSPTDGSRLRSVAFSGGAGDELDFYFNYVTSDGSGYADYAWARLLDGSLNEVALLFTARTAPSGSIVPGFSMPAPAATLSPSSVPIISGGPAWSPLGGYSGSCWDAGCGYTGWVESTFVIPSAGDYVLEFGVVNWSDNAYDSGLAFDGVTVGGEPIDAVPEPGSLLLLGSGLAGLIARRRARR